MTSDPATAIADAVVGSLQTSFGATATVRRGWPEHNEDLDLDASNPSGPWPYKAVVAVTPGPSLDEERAPEAISHTDNGDGTTTSLYSYGRTEVTLQVDVWSAYRASRDQVVAEVRKALNNRMPHVAGLNLSVTDYHGVRADVRVADGRPIDDSENAPRGQWRYTFDLEAECELVYEVTEPTTTAAVARVKVDEGETWELTREEEVTP